MARTPIGTPNWGDELNADLDQIQSDALGARSAGMDHGAVSGGITLSSDYAFHEMTLTGDTTINLPATGVMSMAVKVFGTGNLTISGATWDTEEVVLPGTFVLTNWPSSGWHATVVGGSTELVEVTPGTPTFNVGAATVTIPNTTGVQYKKNGVNIAAGTHGGQEGVVTITAVAKTGYVIAVGATTSWNQSYPGWTVVAYDDFAAPNGTLLQGRTTPVGGKVWTDADAAQTIQDSKVMWSTHAVATHPALVLDATPQYEANVDTRMIANYDLTPEPSGSTPAISLTFGYRYNASTQHYIFWKLERTDPGSGVAVLSLDGFNWSGSLPTPTVEAGQSLGNKPLTGEFKVESIGYILKAYINGVLIATADTVDVELVNNKVGVRLGNRYPAILDFQVEQYIP